MVESIVSRKGKERSKASTALEYEYCSPAPATSSRYSSLH